MLNKMEVNPVEKLKTIANHTIIFTQVGQVISSHTADHASCLIWRIKGVLLQHIADMTVEAHVWSCMLCASLRKLQDYAFGLASSNYWRSGL